MCFYSRQSREALTAARRFRAEVRNPDEFLKSDIINGFSHPSCPVITSEDTATIQNYSWGLIPAWSPDISVSDYTLNARIESLSITRSFKEYINNRCLVIADGFYEWRHTVINGKKFRERFLITLPGDELFAFAGLFSHWRDPATGLVKNTFTIVTTAANDLMCQIHNIKQRMPVILKEEDEREWLTGSDYTRFSLPYSVNLIATSLPEIKEKRGDYPGLLF